MILLPWKEFQAKSRETAPRRQMCIPRKGQAQEEDHLLRDIIVTESVVLVEIIPAPRRGITIAVLPLMKNLFFIKYMMEKSLE
ncbi:hypothetical protein DSO57_1004001 [Entomophthora muscae]|uniref:Uncharacterized protein n=1 Tax=Entomophthora muscae TaxID=34485 RepID=A0ACC2SL46_9FUNG|nr:hypothetical protein DSO57_1004001 [Entomophthora muscae]